MYQYSIADLTSNGSPGPIIEIRASATDYPTILELNLMCRSQQLLALGVGIPAAAGIGPKNALILIGDDPNAPPNGVTVATDWQTPPTSPTNFFRRVSYASGPIFPFMVRFPRGLRLASGGSLVIWDLLVPGNVVSPSIDFSIVVDT